MPSKNKPMSHDEIQSVIHGHVADAVTYMETELSPARATATNYYRGEKFGNEEKGRSAFVLTTLRDTVLAILPSLVRLFLPTSGHVIQYQARPKTPDVIDQKVAQAKQATEFVNGPVLQQDNNGFLELYAAFKDALVRWLGTIKFWWEDQSVYQSYTQVRLDVNQYEALLADPDVEVTRHSEQQDGGLTFHDVTYKHWRREGIARLRCVPPEEMLISRDARSREDATFIAHRTEKTRSELLSMGVPAEVIDDYGGISTEVRQSIEELARRGGIAMVDRSPDPATVKHLWIESYPYLDVDGDGIAELVCVKTIGPGCHLVEDPEPVDERPFAFFGPDPEPHVLIGGSIADRVMDLQLMGSSVIRAGADSLSQSLFPDTYYMEGVVDRQAMRSKAIGKDIEVRDGVRPADAILEHKHESGAGDALAMMQYLDAVKMQRVGPLPATLDPDALQSTPAIGVKATVQAASEQVELIARVFAATGMQQLGSGLLKLLVEHQPRKRIARLSGGYVEVDPKAWDADMDVQVTVATGTQEKLGILAANAAEQKAVLQFLGPTNPLVGVGQLLHTYRTMLEMQGIPDVGKYWNELPTNWQPPPAPPQPDPNLLLAQAEMVKAQAKLQKDQADFQMAQVSAQQEMAQLKADLASKAAELQIQREKMHLDDNRERDKVEAQIALGVAELNARHQTAVTVEQIRGGSAQLNKASVSFAGKLADLDPRQTIALLDLEGIALPTPTEPISPPTAPAKAGTHGG